MILMSMKSYNLGLLENIPFKNIIKSRKSKKTEQIGINSEFFNILQFQHISIIIVNLMLKF